MLDKILETERLIMRMLHSGDIAAIAKMHSDPDVMALSGAGGTLNEIETWKYCCMNLGHWLLKGYGMYLLESKGENEFCGLVGLRYLPDYHFPELSWILPKSKWGHGYAIEAAHAVKEHAFQKLKFNEIYHFIDSKNEKSIRLAEKLGAVLHKEITEHVDSGNSKGLMYVLRPTGSQKI